jgi:hypothetical protein
LREVKPGSGTPAFHPERRNRPAEIGDLYETLDFAELRAMATPIMLELGKDLFQRRSKRIPEIARESREADYRREADANTKESC